MNKTTKKFLLGIVILASAIAMIRPEGEQTLYTQEKIKNYLPHMSWADFERARETTDLAIMPVGSIEQHGRHLPLGTDFYSANEIAKGIAQKVDGIVVPVLMAGLAEYHMGFPGTLTLSPATFEAVLLETAGSLVRHGIRKIAFYNGHGGNTVSVRNVIRRINQQTPATAFLLNDLPLAPHPDLPEYPPLDWHAGVRETSQMLFLTPGLVQLSLATKPVLTVPEDIRALLAMANRIPVFQTLAMASIFTPLDTGKGGSTREITDTGAFTRGDPGDARRDYGEIECRRLVEAAVRFLLKWQRMSDE